jgi:hypothetical protein
VDALCVFLFFPFIEFVRFFIYAVICPNHPALLILAYIDLS